MTFEDAFKMIQINSTESDKKKLWNYQDASSLSSKLKALDNVQDAVVTLTMPEQSLFVESGKDTVKPTASVIVTPKGQLTPKQVQGIVMMVSHSVENLNPKDVIVLDNNSNILNSDIGDDAITTTNNQYDMTQKRKTELEKNVKDMFYGQFDNFDNIRVVANPVLDFNKKTQQTNALSNPDGQTSGALITNEQSKEKMVNAGTGGAPGVDSNPGTTPAPSYQTGTSGNGTYDKATDKQQYDYTRTVTQEEKALGDLDTNKSSMTVSLLYGIRVADDTKMTQPFIDQFKKDISSATGIAVANISVNKYKITPPVVEKKPIADVVRDYVNTYGLFALMLFLIIGLMVAAIPRKKVVLEQQQQEFAAAAAGGGPVGGPRFIVPEASGEHIPEIDMEERSEVKKQIEKFVKQKPDAVAQLLRNWLSDDWEG
jgi:flagellar M-ring protein FliF